MAVIERARDVEVDEFDDDFDDAARPGAATSDITFLYKLRPGLASKSFGIVRRSPAHSSHTLTIAPPALCRPRWPARAAPRERPHQGSRAGKLERGASTTCARDARPSRCGSLCSWRADGRPGGRGRQEGGARTGPVRGRAGGRLLSICCIVITRDTLTHILRNRSDVVSRDGGLKPSGFGSKPPAAARFACARG